MPIEYLVEKNEEATKGMGFIEGKWYYRIDPDQDWQGPHDSEEMAVRASKLECASGNCGD